MEFPARLLGLMIMLLVLQGAEAADASGRFMVGFAQDDLANDWRLAQVRDLEKEFARYPEIDFIHTDARGSTAKQIRDIEDLARRGVDVLLASPRDARAMTPAIASVYRRGIPVVLLTRAIATDDFTTLIAPDDETIGRKAAEFIAAALHGSGRVLVLQGLASTSTAAGRTRGFEQGLARFPGVSVVAVRQGNYLRSDAIRAMEEVLREGLKFDAIFAQSDSMASGARIALRRAGIDPRDLIIVGVDYIGEARRAIRTGEQRASFTYPTCAKEAVRAVRRILAGQTVPTRIQVKSGQVTADNVDEVEPIF